MKFELPVEKAKVAERTQASILTDLIRRDIIAGIFPPGSKLLLRVLAERYTVGIIPLREALSRLAMSGFVEVVDQRGFRVAQASKEELLDIMRVMTNLEAEALEDSIAHGDLEWEGKVVAAYHQLSKLPMLNEKLPGTLNSAWEEAHDAFHTALLSACSSPWLLRLAALLRGHQARYRFLTVREIASGSRDAHAEHSAILAAVLRRDAGAACSNLVEHFNTTARLALAAPVKLSTPKRTPRTVTARA